MMIFNASMDTFTKISTAIVVIIFGGVLLTIYYSATEIDFLTILIPLLIFVSIFFGCFVFRPISYQLNENEIIVNRLISNVYFDFSQIKELKSIKKMSLFSTIRVFGVGGIFGYFGLFWNSTYGNMTFYASKKDGLIMIVTCQNKKIVITPDEVDVFLEQFLKIKNGEISK